MLKLLKLVALIVTSLTGACASMTTQKAQQPTDYRVSVVGDDALTMTLAQLLRTAPRGLRLIPYDGENSSILLIRINTNLHYRKIKGVEYAFYQVEFRRGSVTLDRIANHCRISMMSACRDQIFERFRHVRLSI